MVDTGTSVIALKPEDAGIRPAERDYAAMVTANGAIRVAPVELDTVEIEDLEVHNVAAVVLPPGVADENLLGLSFLRAAAAVRICRRQAGAGANSGASFRNHSLG